MNLVFASEKVELQCTSMKHAMRLLGGDKPLAVSLLARINALEQADTIKDIIVQPKFRFHNLGNKGGRDLSGFFAIDVKTIREQWRIILQPLNDQKEPFDPCHIDEIAGVVRIVSIEEVSKHYE